MDCDAADQMLLVIVYFKWFRYSMQWEPVEFSIGMAAAINNRSCSNCSGINKLVFEDELMVVIDFSIEIWNMSTFRQYCKQLPEALSKRKSIPKQSLQSEIQG